MTINPGFITLHIVNDIPYSNLNRDDSGSPKRTMAGGVERGLLSSQSIKRAVRKDYEKRSKVLTPTVLDPSYRSRNLATLVSDRALEIAYATESEVNEKKLRTNATAIVKKLTGGDTMAWLSVEEIEALAIVLADEVAASTLAQAKGDEAFNVFLKKRGITGSLAIAAFGRMFANATAFQTEAALAVSPAVSTHGSVIETDYFITAEDFQLYNDDKTGGSGAGHLGVALYTSGIFYRTITIDVKELWANWSGRNSAFKEELLTQFLQSVIYALPTGKKNSTAPYTEPLLVIAEQQSYRSAYSVTAPILSPGEDGYKSKTVKMLKKQSELARRISPGNYADRAVSGVMGDSFVQENEYSLTMPALISQLISWLDEQIPTEEVSAEALTEAEALVETPYEAPAVLDAVPTPAPFTIVKDDENDLPFTRFTGL